MPNIAVIDAGPLIAIFNNRDAYHSQIRESIKTFRSQYGRLTTTWPVVSEAVYMLHVYASLKAQSGLLQWIVDGYLEIFELQREHVERILILQEKYANSSMQFADGSLVVVAEEMKTNNIFSSDFQDFAIYRIFQKQPFQNLMKKIE